MIITPQKSHHKITSDKKKFKNIFWLEFNSSSTKLLICYTLNDYYTLSNFNRKKILGAFQRLQSQSLH
jgi:hypothetical protein